MGNLCQTPTLGANMEQSLDWDTPNILLNMTESLYTKQKLIRDISQDVTNFVVSPFYKKQEPVLDGDFNDPIFPRKIESIYNESQSHLFNPQQRSVLDKLIWVRPKDVMKPGFKLYDTIDWNDVQFGLLHNSYFLSSLSNLAIIPDSFKKILLTKQISENGLYKVQFYINGKPKLLIVDEYFPAYSSKSWVFSRSTPTEFWVQIMEKAWAKLCGNYAATIEGLPSDALSCLIEAPCFTFNVNRIGPKRVWNEILNALTNRFIISANSLNTDPEGSLSNLGLTVNEPYTIIDAREYKGLRFIRLRNPWVGYEWKGDYSDSSSLWTQDLKENLSYVNDADGIFYMLYEDFCKYFHFTYVSKFHPDFNYNYKKFKQDKTDNYVASKILVSHSQVVHIGLHQKQERFYKKVQGYKLPFARLLIAKYNSNAKAGEDCYEFIGSDYSNQDKLYVTETLTEGEYHIFGNIKWTYSEASTFVISTYSKENIEVQALNRVDVPVDYLNQIITSYLNKNKPETEKIHQSISVSKSLDDNNTGYAMINFRNENINENLLVSFTNPSSECAVISGTISKIEGKNEIYLKRNNQKLVIFEDNVNHLKPFDVTEYEVNSYSTDSGNDTSDPINNFIARNIEAFVKKRLNDDVFVIEYAYKSNIYIVIINENPTLNYKVRINFNRICNLTFTVNEKSIRSRSFDYFELNGTPNQYPDYELTVSMKSFN